jgi:hypothetical protein
MDEVEEQAELASIMEAAIAAAEPYVQSEVGTGFTLNLPDDGSIEADPEVLASLQNAVDDLNTAISDGEIAMQDVQTSTEFANV